VNVKPDDPPHLLADIGNTLVRFALHGGRGVLLDEQVRPCSDFGSLLDALHDYLARHAGRDIRHAAVAVNSPVDDDRVELTNGAWSFSIEATRRDAGLQTLVVVNDFTALAAGLSRLDAGQRRQVGGGEARPGEVIGLLGAGSGLGVSGLVSVDDGWVSLATEGGHACFSPRDAREDAVFALARRRYAHVSAERLLSWAGLPLIWQALGDTVAGEAVPDAGQILSGGLATPPDPRCHETLTTFCAMLGTVASNLAVTLGARGGLYLGGSLVRQLGPFFDASPFRARFESKGRFSTYLQRIPTWVLTDARAGLIGLASVLEAELAKRGSRHALLDLIQRARPVLSPAERRVADLVLTRPRTVLTDPLMDIARNAQVSQPTVIRFCRSLGLDGLSEFRLQLAATLSATVPLRLARFNRSDDAGPAAPLDRPIALLQRYQTQIDRAALDAVVAALAGATRLLLLAPASLGALADEGALRLMRAGRPCTVLAGTALQQAGLQATLPGDLAVCLRETAPDEGWPALMAALRQRHLPTLVIGPGAAAWARPDRGTRVWPLPDSGDTRLLLQVTLDLFADALAARAATA
jgi:glucokinase